MEFITNNKGGIKLCYEGFMYTKKCAQGRKMWKMMCQKERQFRSFVGARQVKTLKRNEFLYARKVFDKKLRFYERQYNNKFIENLENITTTNPKDFWKKIKQLGPRRTKIPMTVYDEQGNLCHDTQYVLNK